MSPYEFLPLCGYCKTNVTAYTGACVDTMPPFYTFRCVACKEYTSVFEPEIPKGPRPPDCAACAVQMVDKGYAIETCPPTNVFGCPKCNAVTEVFDFYGAKP